MIHMTVCHIGVFRGVFRSIADFCSPRKTVWKPLHYTKKKANLCSFSTKSSSHKWSAITEIWNDSLLHLKNMKKTLQN